MKLLLVDADSNRQRQLRTILVTLGYKSADVESTSNLADARSKLLKSKFDCLFACISIPLNGIELLTEIRAGHQSIKELPVVMYSSGTTREAVIEAVNAGATTFIGVPFSASDVEAALKLAKR